MVVHLFHPQTKLPINKHSYLKAPSYKIHASLCHQINESEGRREAKPGCGVVVHCVKAPLYRMTDDVGSNILCFLLLLYVCYFWVCQFEKGR